MNNFNQVIIKAIHLYSVEPIFLQTPGREQRTPRKFRVIMTCKIRIHYL